MFGATISEYSPKFDPVGKLRARRMEALLEGNKNRNTLMDDSYARAFNYRQPLVFGLVVVGLVCQIYLNAVFRLYESQERQR